MIFRTATGADREAIVRLALHFHASTPYAAFLVVDRERVSAMFDVVLEHGVALVAEAEHSDEGGEIVAFLALVATDHKLSGERFAEEQAWWVEPAYRRGTIGPHLLKRAEAWAAAEGCAFLVMFSPVGSGVGNYYDRCGYVAVETAWMKRVA